MNDIFELVAKIYDFSLLKTEQTLISQNKKKAEILFKQSRTDHPGRNELENNKKLRGFFKIT